MELTHVILGPVVTEKAERQKSARTYSLAVAAGATKVDVTKALEKFYDVEVKSIRVMRVRAKSRPFGGNRNLEKRHAMKKMLVTLTSDSKALDLASFKS
jgi:large subunit ribosomal protein L23